MAVGCDGVGSTLSRRVRLRFLSHHSTHPARRSKLRTLDAKVCENNLIGRASDSDE